jgi:hypothetical protein
MLIANELFVGLLANVMATRIAITRANFFSEYRCSVVVGCSAPLYGHTMGDEQSYGDFDGEFSKSMKSYVAGAGSARLR